MFVLGLANGPPTQWLISPEQLAGAPSCSRTTQHNSTLSPDSVWFASVFWWIRILYLVRWPTSFSSCPKSSALPRRHYTWEIAAVEISLFVQPCARWFLSFSSIHPSSVAASSWVAGAYTSCHRVKTGQHPVHVGSSWQGHTERQTTIHTYTSGQFGVPNLLHMHVFGLLEEAGETGVIYVYIYFLRP